MPSYRHHELGDLYIRINVNFPSTIDPTVIPLLEQALPARNIVQKFNKKIHVDEVTLEEPNDRQKRSAASNGDEMDEDDEDGRPGVQCAQRKPVSDSAEESCANDMDRVITLTRRRHLALHNSHHHDLYRLHLWARVSTGTVALVRACHRHQHALFTP
jgi:hypothetical protein